MQDDTKQIEAVSEPDFDCEWLRYISIPIKHQPEFTRMLFDISQHSEGILWQMGKYEIDEHAFPRL